MAGKKHMTLWAGVLVCLLAPDTAGAGLSVYPVDDSVGLGRQFDGIGAISGGGATSKLLVNYEEPYRSQVLDYLFKPNFGASLHIFKVEIGGDSQSTDGTESSHMHSEDDLNFNRGYEWWMMKEAKKRNPNIKLYGLPWVFPGWLGGQDFNPYSNRTNLVQYIMNWITGAYKVHGLYIDYIGIWNERKYDPTYIKMLRKALDTSGFNQTKIVAADGTWAILNDFYDDPELARAISIIGEHYPGSYSPDNALRAERPLWASEEYSANNDLHGGGCWARVLNEGYVNGFLTGTIAWNLVTGYYDYLPYARSSLMTANKPWSGYYEVNSPIWMTAHHTQFMEIGWQYLKHGYGVGNLTGNGTFISITDPSRRHLTIVIETMDPADAPCFYPMPHYPVVASQDATFVLKGSYANIKTLAVWKSQFDYQGNNTNLFVRQDDKQLVNGVIQLTLEKNVVYTLTTVTTALRGVYDPPPTLKPFPLPYKDDFEGYSESEEPYNLAQQAGAFEVQIEGDNKVIKQMVPQPPVDTCLPLRMTRPVNVFGDHTWSDIFIQMDVKVPAGGSTGAYIASRVSKGSCDSMYSNGIYFWVQMDKQMFQISGNHSRTVVYASSLYPLKYDTWYTLGLKVQGNSITAYIDRRIVVNINIPNISSVYGHMAFGTETFASGLFDNLMVDSASNAGMYQKVVNTQRRG